MLDGTATKTSMERPLKRVRLSGNTDPETDLRRRRAQNDSRLKSIFESIFEKYGKDFEGVGDEIDMRTGEIVVNNGHILGMTGEKDAGDAGSSSEELESGYYSEDQDIETPVGYYELQDVGQKLDDSVHADLMAELEVSWRSDDDADSLMGAIEVEHPSIEANTILSVENAVSDSEEDELANSDFQWMTPRHIFAVAEGRWRRGKQKNEPFDDSTIELAWRATPISKLSPSSQRMPDVRPISIDDVQDDLDSEGEGVSLWAPEGKKLRRRRSRKSYPPTDQPLLEKREGYDTKIRPSHKSVPSQVSWQRYWTREDEKLLRKLKATTRLTYRDMQKYFPYRTKASIGLHWRIMMNREKASLELKASARPGSNPFSRSTTSFQVDKGDEQMTLGYNTSNGTKGTDFLPKTINSAVRDRTIDTEKLPDAFIDEYLIQPDESTQGAGVIGSVAVQPPPTVEGQREGLNIATATSVYSASGTGNHDSLLTLPVVQGSPRSACLNSLNAPIYQDDNIVPQLMIENSEEEALQTEIFMRETKTVIGTAVARLRGHCNTIGPIRPNRTEVREPIMSTAARHRSVEDDRRVRSQRCAQTLASKGFDVVSQPSNQGGRPKQGQIIREEIKFSPVFEEPTDDAPLSLQTASAAMPEICFPLQNPAVTPSPIVQEATKSPPVEYSPQEGQFRATSMEMYLTSEQLDATTLKPVTPEHVLQVLVPCSKSNAGSRGSKVPVHVTIDKWKPDLEVQSSESNSNRGEMAQQSPPESSSCAVKKDRPAVPISQSHIDKINTRNVRYDQLQCDSGGPPGHEIPDSQPSSMSTTVPRTPRSQERLAKRSAPLVPQSSGRGHPSVPPSPRTQKKSKRKRAIVNSFSSISEAMLDCSEDELSFM
ncbi:hypothetical protein N7G274_005702 [Stereocaulon virgatum]|uniref:Myb-like domain-containing protein n=1 Tax=Stereocaulon virgatum TaxID=373712 RepID=A0ABR4A757_9LECA